MGSLSNQIVLDLLQNKRYGVEYQPIICVVTGEVVAYEALFRFYSSSGESIRPDLVYASLHHNLLSLYQVEYEQKKIQLENAPLDKKIFVNLDQAELLLPKVEQLPNDRYRRGESVRGVIKSVEFTSKGPEIMLSRADNMFLERLFEMEVPEIEDGIIDREVDE